MTDRQFQVGDHVLVRSGNFENLDGLVEGIDTDADTVTVGIVILGRKTPVEFDLGSIRDHIAPFGDVEPVLRCPYEGSLRDELLEEVPGADIVFRSTFTHSSHKIGVGTTICIAHLRGSYRIIGRYGGGDVAGYRTTPIYFTPVDRELSTHDWEAFEGLLEACGFWLLPYDDGRRIPQERWRFLWDLQGCDKEQCHAVYRVTEGALSDISECCEYLKALAPEAL